MTVKQIAGEGERRRKGRPTGRKAGGKDMVYYGESCQDAIYFCSAQEYNGAPPELSQ